MIHTGEVHKELCSHLYQGNIHFEPIEELLWSSAAPRLGPETAGQSCKEQGSEPATSIYPIGWMSFPYAMSQHTTFGFLLLFDTCSGASRGGAVHVSQRSSPSFPGSHLAAWLWGSAGPGCVFSSMAVLKLCSWWGRCSQQSLYLFVFQRFPLRVWRFPDQIPKKKCSLWTSLIFKGSMCFITLSESLQIEKMAAIGFRGHRVNLAPASCLWMSGKPDSHLEELSF